MSDKWYISGPLAIGAPEPTGQLTIESRPGVNQGSLTFFSNGADVEYDGGEDELFAFRNTSTNGRTAFVGGNVGIGTITPRARLEVAEGAIMPASGNVDTSGILFPPDPGGGGGDKAWMRYYPRVGEATTLEIGVANDADDHIALIPSGGVGIGSIQPGAKLTIQTPDTYTGNTLRLEAKGEPDRYYLNVNTVVTPGIVRWIFDQTNAGTNFSNVLAFDRGNVGIGTAEPRAKLEVPGGGILNGLAIGVDPPPTPEGDITFPWPHETIGTFNPSHNLRLHSNNSIAFHTGNAQPNPSAIIDNAGNLTLNGGIVYSNHLNKLDVAEGDTHARIRAHDLWLGHSSRGKKGQAPSPGTPDTRDTVGRALVDSDDELIQVDLTTTKHLRTLVINYGRDWEAVLIHGHVNTPSSRKLKESIEPLSGEKANSIIAALEPVTYFYKNDELKLRTLGFVAEDAPNEVASPNHEAITFNHITAALTRVVKDQAESISNLQTQVELLTREHAAMKKGWEVAFHN